MTIMSRPLSKVAPDWWDYTTLDAKILEDAARLTAEDLAQLSRPGSAWRCTTRSKNSIWPKRSSTSRLAAIDGGQSRGHLRPDRAHGAVAAGGAAGQRVESERPRRPFLGHGRVDRRRRPALPAAHPLSFARADKELCFDRIKPELRMPRRHLHFPINDLAAYSRQLRPDPLRGDAGRAGRRQALGIQ